MLDAGCPSETALPRAEGRARVGVAARAGRTRLADLAQSGSAKVMLPRVEGPTEAVFLNTAGGITGGDRLSYAAEAGEGAHLVCTTQTAERLYRAQPGTTGRLSVSLAAGPGATLEWLAQETIVFDRAALSRRIEADVAETARLTVVEPLVLGRAAMGETVREARLADAWRIRRAGRPVYADGLRLSGAVTEIAARPGLFAGHRAAATLVHVAPDAEDRLGAVRAALPETGGASVRDGVLVVRLLAAEGRALRSDLVRLLGALRAGPLPRVWTM